MDKWINLKIEIQDQIKLLHNSELQEDADTCFRYEEVLRLMFALETRDITLPTPEKGIKQLINIQNIRLKRLEEQSLLGEAVKEMNQTIKELNQTIVKLIGQLKFVR